MITKDRFGRLWNLSAEELCKECGQPDNCGDCNHEPLTDEQAQTLGALPRASLGEAWAVIDRLGNDPLVELPEPWAQSYANFYLLMEDFIVGAIEAGIDPDVLRTHLSSDVDTTISNHEDDSPLRGRHVGFNLQ